MRYRFTRAVRVEHADYAEGQVVDGGAIPPGHLQSMLSVGWVVEEKEKPKRQPKATRKAAPAE